MRFSHTDRSLISSSFQSVALLFLFFNNHYCFSALGSFTVSITSHTHTPPANETFNHLFVFHSLFSFTVDCSPIQAWVVLFFSISDHIDVSFLPLNSTRYVNARECHVARSARKYIHWLSFYHPHVILYVSTSHESVINNLCHCNLTSWLITHHTSSMWTNRKLLFVFFG